MTPETSSIRENSLLHRPAGLVGTVLFVFALAAIAGFAADFFVIGEWQGGALFFASVAVVLAASLGFFAALAGQSRRPPDRLNDLIGNGQIFDAAGRRVVRQPMATQPQPDAYTPRDLGRRLYEAIENFPEGIAIWGADDRLIMCNEQYRRMSGPLAPFARQGVSFEELLRHAIDTSIYETGDAGAQEFFRRRIAEHRNPGPPAEYPQADGRWLLIREHRTRDGGSISLYTDITSLKRAQIAAQATAQELEEKRRQLDVALNNISQGIAFFDSEQKLVLCNRRYRELYRLSDDVAQPGVTLRELLETSVGLGNYPTDQGRRVLDRRIAIAERRLPSVMDTSLADGRLIEVNFQPLAAGGSVATFTDVTEREHTSRALMAAKDAAEAANRAKTEFLTKMSHELRTPLNAVIGFSEVIRDQFFGPAAVTRYANYAADINYSGQHLLHVINDILDMARIEAGQQRIIDEVVDIGEQIVHAQSMLAGSANASGIRLENDLRDMLPQLRADQRSVLQVLLNLLTNAVKFTPAGGTVTVRAWSDRLGDVMISVTDTGIGIAEKDRERIFEPFFQAEAGTNRRFGGTGLGLSICRNIMSLHGGSIDVDSQLGHGTRVTIRFPAARVVRAEARLA